ncbi:MAG: hypothetical protein FWE11_06370 [Defluviitaleaceae bacterium]|nr:hypothetical protein [Defluviitaleaceae bacterium]
MDKLISKLLEIENAGNVDIHEIKQEEAAQAQLIKEEIERSILDIKRRGDKEFQNLKQQAESDTQAELDEVERWHKERITAIKNLFYENESKWRQTWRAHILQVK